MLIVFVSFFLHLFISSQARLGESHALLDLSNRERRVEALGACPRAVENCVASIQAHAVVEGILALGLLLVTRVGDPAVRLEENGGSEVLLLVPPIGRARRRAAGAKNTFVKTVELLAVLLGLAVLTTLVVVSGVQLNVSKVTNTYVRRRSGALQIRLDRAVLLVEERHVRDKVLDNVHVGKRVDARLLGGVCGNAAQAGQGVDTVDVHGAATADTLTTTPPEGKSGVDLVLDANERIQHHGSGLVQVECVGLHLGL